MSTILVAGGTGFIGRNLVSYLRDNEYECVVVGRSLQENLETKYMDLDGFFNITSNEFRKLSIDHVVYAIGDPNMNGKRNSENDILTNFLDKLNLLGFRGRFVLISSNAANPDSGLTTSRYRKSLKNDYILRKQSLESSVISHSLNAVILRAPAVIGLDMNQNSHVKRILCNTRLRNLMSLSVFRGSIEVLDIYDLCQEVEGVLRNEILNTVIEPCSPSYRWYELARFLSRDENLPLDRIDILNRTQQFASRLIPTRFRFLFFPHWVTKSQDDDLKVRNRHLRVQETLKKVREKQYPTSREIIVTGAGSGLGAEICSLLLDKRHQIIGVDKVQPEQSVPLMQLLKNQNFQYLQGDLNSFEFVKEILGLIERKNLSGMFCIAGIGPRIGATENTVGEISRIFNVNFFGPVQFVNRFIRTKGSESYFVFVGSSSGIDGLPFFGAYSASKAALHAYFFSLICELQERDIKVFGAIPSGMKTNFQTSNNVRKSSLDKLLLQDPRKIAASLVNWTEDRNRKSKIRYFGVSSRVFLLLRNLPFATKSKMVRFISKGTR